MSSTLTDFIAENGLESQLMSPMQIEGFVTALAAAPHVIDPAEWLAYLWGGEETAPFSTHEQLEQFARLVVERWNASRKALFEGNWQWPSLCQLDEAELVSDGTREFADGLLQGWSLTRDDWEALMPEDSEDSALLGGVILSVSMMFDPETAIATMEQYGAIELAQFEEVYNAMPMMLSGLAMKGQMLAAEDQ